MGEALWAGGLAIGLASGELCREAIERDVCGVSRDVSTVRRELRRMGYAKLSARPRPYAEGGEC